MRILLDQDMVLADWVGTILEWYNADHGTSFIINDLTDWEMSVLGPDIKLYLRSAMRSPEFWTELKPIPGAIEGMKALIDAGHDVLIVSAVPKFAGIAYHGKLEWLRRHMPFFNLNHFVACQRKELIQGDLLADDGPHNLEAFRKTGRPTVVFDYPWNASYDGATYRARNWECFLYFINSLVNKT